MAKMTIIEGNSNDKDNVRAYMVKGEAGVSPTVQTSKEGKTATITITDYTGPHTFTLDDGFSPVITTSKENKVTTVTITDAEGTHTATINDGEVSTADLEAGLATKANTSHTHTKSEIIDFAHNHDDRYYTKTEANTVQTATITATKNDINFTLRFKRNINVVTLNVEMFIPSTVTAAVNWLSSSDFTMPEWAKTSDNTVVNLDNTIICGGYSISNSMVGFSSVARVALSRANSSDYRLMFLYNQSDNTSYPDGQTLIANLQYIVID